MFKSQWERLNIQEKMGKGRVQSTKGKDRFLIPSYTEHRQNERKQMRPTRKKGFSEFKKKQRGKGFYDVGKNATKMVAPGL